MDIEKLKRYPVIDKNYLMKHFGYSAEYTYLVLYRLEKRKYIKKIMKGKYTAIDDIYKIATNIYFPSYISFLTASMLKGSTEQIINTVQVVSNYNRKIRFEKYLIEFIKVKYLFGYENSNGIFISTNEKLLLDMLQHRNYSGNFSEIEKAIENLDIDEKRLITYLKRISEQALVKRVGFLLEKHKKIDIRGSFELDSNYILLDVAIKRTSKTSSKWRIKYDN